MICADLFFSQGVCVEFVVSCRLPDGLWQSGYGDASAVLRRQDTKSVRDRESVSTGGSLCRHRGTLSHVVDLHSNNPNLYSSLF